jgi:amino acid permease
MLASCYEANGVEHGRYHHAVRHLLGRKSAIVVSFLQILNLFFFSLVFTITASNSMVQIAQLACEIQGKDVTSASCLSPETGGTWKMNLVFGGVEMLFSQIKNLEEAWWSSLLGSVSGVVYVFILVIIGFANVSNGEGSVSGITTDVVCPDANGIPNIRISAADKVFGVLNGIGTIAFCFNFSLILLEVQDTLKQPPSAVKQMKKTCIYAIGSSFLCYFIVAVTGYAAEGDCVDSIIINSYGSPKWALIICYINVLINMIMSYQVFGQSMFDTIESQVKWYLLKKKLKKARKESKRVQEESDMAKMEQIKEDGVPITPFDRAHTDLEKDGTKTKKKKDLYAEEFPSLESFGFDHTHLEPLTHRISAALSSQISDPRLSTILTSQPIEQPEEHSLTMRDSMAMFTHDTGFANEEVPLNDEGYLLPFAYRAVIRCTYVAIMTIITCVLPFFEAIAGLSGAISFFPLSIYFPFSMYTVLYKDSMSRQFILILRIIAVFTLVIGMAATVGAFRNMIVGWSSFNVFQT